MAPLLALSRSPVDPDGCLLLAVFGLHAMSGLSPECAPKRTSADHSEFMGSRHRCPLFVGDDNTSNANVRAYAITPPA